MRRSLAPGAALAGWTELETGPIPGGGGSLRLVRRDDEYLIVVAGMELMGSHRSGSERDLASLACAALRDRAGPRMLIGGLGMGFTLRAALSSSVPTRGSSSPSWCRRSWPGPAARWPTSSAAASTIRGSRSARPTSTGDPVRAAGLGRDPARRRQRPARPGQPGERPALRFLGAEAGVLGPAAGRRARRLVGCPDRHFKARLQRIGFAVVEHRIRSERPGRTPHVVWIATRPARAGEDAAGRRGGRTIDRANRGRRPCRSARACYAACGQASHGVAYRSALLMPLLDPVRRLPVLLPSRPALAGRRFARLGSWFVADFSRRTGHHVGDICSGLTVCSGPSSCSPWRSPPRPRPTMRAGPR